MTIASASPTQAPDRNHLLDFFKDTQSSHAGRRPSWELRWWGGVMAFDLGGGGGGGSNPVNETNPAQPSPPDVSGLGN